MFCERLVEQFNSGPEEDFPISPLVGSIIVGLTSMVSTIFAYFMIKYFGRKTLLVMG